MAEPTTPERRSNAITEDPPLTAIARSEQAINRLGWPYAAVPGAVLGLVEAWPRGSQATLESWPRALAARNDHPLARRVIGSFGLVLGASAGLVVGGLAATLLAALFHPFMPHLARLLLLCITMFSLAVGAVVGRRVLQRETFE